MTTQTIQGLVYRTVVCSHCGEENRFWGATQAEVFEREEAAGWQSGPVRSSNVYSGTCPACSETDLGCA